MKDIKSQGHKWYEPQGRKHKENKRRRFIIKLLETQDEQQNFRNSDEQTNKKTYYLRMSNKKVDS